MSQNPVIVEGVRTPFGRFGGCNSELEAAELAAIAFSSALERTSVAPDELSETILGTAIMGGATFVLARQVNHKVGIPLEIPSLTVDRACCSSVTALGLAALKIKSGEAEIVLTGGVDSPSQTPFLMRNMRFGRRLGDQVLEDPMHIRNPMTGLSLAFVTGTEALKFDISREEQDEWAVGSHEKYFSAYDKGNFDDELTSVDKGDNNPLIDEPPRRDTSLDRLKKLPTVYDSPTVTAGNVPGLNDGASALMVMSQKEARNRNLPILGEIISYAQVAGDLQASVYTPGLGIQQAIKKADLKLADLKRIEINEAFAAMPLVSTKFMADGDKKTLSNLRSITNVNGGAVAIGHPPGASGARIVMSILRELKRNGGGYGAASICGGYGQGDAVVVKV
jgi:acetyl-CoA C-acetyltransferase